MLAVHVVLHMMVSFQLQISMSPLFFDNQICFLERLFLPITYR